LLTSLNIKALVTEKSGELLARSPVQAWAACASIWSRVLVLSGPAWSRAPDLSETMRMAFSRATQRAAGMDSLVPAEPLLVVFEAFDVEDDGSAEWNYMIDLIEMIAAAIGGQDVGSCLETTLWVYLEETFNALTRTYAVADGRPVSYTEAKERVAADPEWHRAVDFINAL
jgi:hypothetical protein